MYLLFVLKGSTALGLLCLLCYVLFYCNVLFCCSYGTLKICLKNSLYFQRVLLSDLVLLDLKVGSPHLCLPEARADNTEGNFKLLAKGKHKSSKIIIHIVSNETW